MSTNVLQYIIYYFDHSKHATTLHLQKPKILLREFFVYRNAAKVVYYESALRLFYYCILQVSLFLDVYEKTSYAKEFSSDPTISRNP